MSVGYLLFIYSKLIDYLCIFITHLKMKLIEANLTHDFSSLKNPSCIHNIFNMWHGDENVQCKLGIFLPQMQVNDRVEEKMDETNFLLLRD